jgi:hypothetical protein
VQVGPVTLGYGNPTKLKAELREEELARFQALPLAERVLRTLEMTAWKEPDGSKHG